MTTRPEAANAVSTPASHAKPASGLTSRQVASQLRVSVKTVEYHLRNSYIKLDITSRRALAPLLH